MTELPEHGMGYQYVDITLANGTLVKHVLVCNSTVVVFSEGMPVFTEDEIAAVGASQRSNK